MKESAIVLRTRPYRDYDVIVDLIAEQTGRTAALARGARRSRRRFGAALTLGAVIDIELHRRSASGLHTLTSCDIKSLPKAASGDLARFYQLAYVLEATSGVCVEGVKESTTYAHLRAYLQLLERTMPSHEQLCIWELRLMSLHGYQLQFWPCVQTGEAPDGFSLTSGGAVQRQAVNAFDATPVPAEVLRRYAALDHGASVQLDDTEHEWLRVLMGRAWCNILGGPLKSSEFLGPETFGPSLPDADLDDLNIASSKEPTW